MTHSDTQKRGILSRFLRWGMIWALRGFGVMFSALLALLFASKFINPSITPYIIAERLTIGPIERDWLPIEDISSHVIYAAIGAEDAKFCAHFGVDWAALQTAINDGGRYGASSITQQTVKNTLLWHGRSYVRKVLELAIAPLADRIWGKSRTLEIYLNIAEFGTGLFGIEAAAHHHFGTSAKTLSQKQAAQLIALLPNPKDRSVHKPDRRTRSYARKVQLNAQIVERDGMAACVRD